MKKKCTLLLSGRSAVDYSFLFCFALFVVLLVGNTVLADVLAQKAESKESLPAEAQVPQTYWQEISSHMIFSAKFDAYYSLSEQTGKDSLSGGGLNGLLVPGYKLSDRAVFLLLYNGEYYQRRDFYSDLVGPRERTEFQSHTITPMLKMDFGENRRYSVIPSLFYTRTYNKDVGGGGWDDGLYNYRDKGVGVDFKIKKLGFGSADGALKLGLQYYKREYPNYLSLLDLATGNAIERDERDYDGILARVGYASWANPTGLSWSADYYLLNKDLKGKKVVDFNGVLTGEGQKDYLQGLELRTWYVPESKPGLRVGLDLTGSLNRSNQNYWDNQGVFPPVNSVFMADFYDYNSYGVRPNIAYTFPVLPVTSILSYFYQKTDYRGRLAQFPDGTYKGEKQQETRHEINIGLRYDLPTHLSLYARWQYINVQSNNDNETVYSYNHKLSTYYAGLSLRY